jgi:transposase-like protein
MAKIDNFNQIRRSRYTRYFSEEFKRQKVKELEKNIVTITELCKEYELSRTSVYKWIYKYSMKAKKGERQIVERKSDTRKILELKDRIKELEQIVGQKQLKIDFQEKMIEIAEEMYQIQIKKKLNSKPSSGSGVTGTSTRSK